MTRVAAFFLGTGVPSLVAGLALLPLRSRPMPPLSDHAGPIEVIGYGRYRAGRGLAVPLTVVGALFTIVGLVVAVAR
jgi:hypothetical protein